MSNIYETRRLLDEYLLFHYGTAAEVLPWTKGPTDALDFARRTVSELIDAERVTKGGTALDLGCAVGRSSFELATLGLLVTGIDFSNSFIDAARELAASGQMSYERRDEGATLTPLIAKVPDDSPRGNAHFEQGNAMDLRADLGSFDVVHAANLLCRLTEPTRLLARLPALVKSGGQLILTTPCTWLEEFTPPSNWPIGSTRDWLQQELAESFELDLQADLPFLIREHARKYQWSVALGSRWIRK
ncbi:MAG: methyltransferase domain-containing protein [Verrucomicrobiales bacterium]|nr:methyltransferase domain-containing protein [Verrucomicrobiales bacterium]MCP5560092.1 methyltransferase domain-containing protein [Verrucomicrobiaceae bacterium]